MSRATKLIVFASNLAALWIVASLVSRAIPPIFLPAALAFLLALAAALAVGELAVTVVLCTVYAFPAACVLLLNNFIFSYYAIWLAALCGAMLPRSLGSAWGYPRSVEFPLVLWALTLALSWPIVVFRELDFVPSLLRPDVMSASVLPLPPAVIVVWVATVAAIAMTGLLLLDWLGLAFPEEGPERFQARIVWPMLAGAAMAALVAVYQSMVDISFLNRTVFGVIGRTVGTMRDANAFGSVLAMWVPAAAAAAFVAARGKRGTTALLLALLAALLAIALWTTGSRTALLAAMVGLLVLGVAIRSFIRASHLVAAGCAVVLAAGLVIALPSAATGPWVRMRDLLPSFSKAAIRNAAYQLWSRDLYGTAAEMMIADHPLVGVGVGGFNYQYGEALYRLKVNERPPDNAQNWYRQQLAELGLLGSVGWILWTIAFLRILLRRRARGVPLYLGAAAGGVAGVAAASLLGVPTQDTAASISFVVFACWCLKQTGTARARASGTPPPRTWFWAGAAAVLTAFLTGTVYAAATELRPPVRARRIDAPYRYGFSQDPLDARFLWTSGRAVEVLRAEKRWLRLELGAAAPDAGSNPVRVTVRIDGVEVLRVERRGTFPIVRWIRLPDDDRMVLIEVLAGRTWQPPEAAAKRPRGVQVAHWAFSDEPPRGAAIIDRLARAGDP